MLSSTLTHLQKVMQTKIYQIGQFLPVWANNKLLASTRIQIILQEIMTLSALPEIHFKALYRSTINQYAEFVQVIPEEPQAALGGLLNLGIARGVLALRQLNSNSEDKINNDPLLNYAIFTAALFFDVAKVISQQKIVITDDQGTYLKEWYPCLGSMVEQGVEFYKMYPFTSTTGFSSLNHEAAALLARQMMPKEAFAWLSSDLNLFIEWLDALRGEQAGAGRRISHILSLIRQEDIIGLMRTMLQAPIELITPNEIPVDDQFFVWLKEGLEAGTIAVNTQDAYVHVLEDRLYLNNEIFKRFQESKKMDINLNKLQIDFNQHFGQEVATVPVKTEYTAFLMQRTQKSIQVRHGMFAFGALFLVDMATVGADKSPYEKEINAAFQLSRGLPGVKQTVIAEPRQKNTGPNFRLR